MSTLNMKRTVSGSLPDVIARVTAAIQKEGFGVLTRIDLHQKFKEKLGQDVAPVVILGACNPQLALQAYQTNPDVTAVLPCNVVVREVSADVMSVEIVKPSSMMTMLGEEGLAQLALQADARLASALDTL